MLPKAAIVGGGFAAGIVNSIDYSSTIGLGSIVVAGLVSLLVAVASGRNKILKDQIMAWRGNFEAEESHARVLAERLQETHKDNKELSLQLSEAHSTIQRFEQLPNLERLIRLMSDMQERSEMHAQNRHAEIMTAITQIVRRD